MAHWWTRIYVHMYIIHIYIYIYIYIYIGTYGILVDEDICTYVQHIYTYIHIYIGTYGILVDEEGSIAESCVLNATFILPTPSGGAYALHPTPYTLYPTPYSTPPSTSLLPSGVACPYWVYLYLLYLHLVFGLVLNACGACAYCDLGFRV